MVTPELKWPMTNLTPSPANLLATETPCFGSETSSPNSSGDLLAEDAAGGVDVGDRLFDAVLHLRAERGIGAGDRAADAELDLGGRGVAASADAKAQREAERDDRFSSCSSPVARLEARNAQHMPQCYVNGALAAPARVGRCG